MSEEASAVVLGGGGSEVVTAVANALEGMSVRVAETVEEARPLLGDADCVVATAVESARALLGDGDGDLSCPVVVLTPAGGAPLEGHEMVRHHRATDLDTLNSRVWDAVDATRARQRVTGGRQVSDKGGRQVSDKELVERESAYRALVENIPDGGVALFDRDLRYTWVGGEVFEKIDLDPEDVAGTSLEDVHSTAFVDAYADAYRRAFAGERSTLDFAYNGKHFQLQIVPVYDDGEIVAGMAMARDVTDEVARQRDLLVRTRAMDAAAIGLCLTDPTQPDNPLVYVNEGYEQITGYDAEEVLGKNPRHLTGPETEAEPRARMREAVENVETVSVDITNYRKDGTAFVNHVEITPIFDDDGALVHFLGSQVDVTEQHDRERALARQNEQLEEFTSIVSHDLRSPLSVARGRVDLARETEDLSHLDHVMTSLDRASELIEELLKLAREGQALDPSRVERVSLETVARAAWEIVDTPEATLIVVDEWEVDADGSRLQQLFENLFRNSVEHGSTNAENDSSVEVRVGTLSDRCGFFVEDDGPGIPEDVRDRVFEAGVTTVRTGTGFGLAIVRRVAEAHGWDVDIREGERGGARFEFTVKYLDDD